MTARVHMGTGRDLEPPKRRWARKAGGYKTVKEYAIALMLRVDFHDMDGRAVGFDYEYIHRLLKQNFPVITYPGPHKGKPFSMTYKELREIACGLNRDGIRLPVRPRRKSKRTKKGIVK